MKKTLLYFIPRLKNVIKKLKLWILVKIILKYSIGEFVFESADMPEWLVGLILLLCSLAVLCTCLILLVKILTSIFKGSFKSILVKFINADFPGHAKHLTPYIAIIVSF